MPRLLLSLAALLLLWQSPPTGFYVEQTYVLGERFNGYVHAYANRIMPPDKMVGDREIACLLREMKASGIFTNVRTEVVQTGADTRQLTIILDERKARGLMIAAIVLERLPEIDVGVFQAKLRYHGIKPGMPLSKYHYGALAERVNGAMLDSLPQSMDKDEMGIFWFTFRPAGKGRVKLIVSGEYSGCE